MKRVNRLHDHMDRSERIVAAANVAQLVRENSVELSGSQVLQELGRQNQAGRRNPTTPGSSAPGAMNAGNGVGSSTGVSAVLRRLS